MQPNIAVTSVLKKTVQTWNMCYGLFVGYHRSKNHLMLSPSGKLSIVVELLTVEPTQPFIANLLQKEQSRPSSRRNWILRLTIVFETRIRNSVSFLPCWWGKWIKIRHTPVLLMRKREDVTYMIDILQLSQSHSSYADVIIFRNLRIKKVLFYYTAKFLSKYKGERL